MYGGMDGRILDRLHYVNSVNIKSSLVTQKPKSSSSSSIGINAAGGYKGPDPSPQYLTYRLDPSNISYAWAIFVNIIDTVWLVPS